MKLGEPFKPMDPVLISGIFDDNDWAYQVKWDGVRILAHLTNGGVRLFNKRMNERTGQYPELLPLVKNSIKAGEAILDGEVIALRKGKPNFYDVIRRDWAQNDFSIKTLQRELPVNYMLFDIIYLDGQDLRALPWEERQAQLSQNVLESDRLVITDTVDGKGTALFQSVKQHKLEGVVAKKRSSRYILGGKNKLWKKAKVWKKIDCAIGGYTLSDKQLGAFLLGGYLEGHFYYIGKVNAAFKAEEQKKLKTYLESIIRYDCPFANMPKFSGTVLWVKPELVLLVEFLEWTDDFKLRHPKILGFSEVASRDCRLAIVPD